MPVAEPRICGVDEAGRGPIAGPVVAAAVILDPRRHIEGLADSKLLSARRRSALAIEIRRNALAWCVAASSVAEIDTLNILRATLLAMRRAVEGLDPAADEAWIDGNRCPELCCPARAIVGGDRLHASISAASILAKTVRDAHMLDVHRSHPHYRFDRHKGYATREHLLMLERFGPCPNVHRQSVAPVRARLQRDLLDTGPVA
ncbi:MAG: ribonuclease HII [Betaproteobacteria bacterium SG8_39]|nr:MAG: ribonuclease HII [Betaproteobacteria bacterium SG8_39]